jgi:hypothetical protein
MARIKATSTSSKFELMKTEAELCGETNDCSVKAVALAAGVSYKVARDELANKGRKPRKGAYTNQIHGSLMVLGKAVRRVEPEYFIHQYPGAHKNLRNVTTHQPQRFNKVWADGKTYLLYTPRHVLVVVNGVNHDWTVGKAKRVTSIYEVV